MSEVNNLSDREKLYGESLRDDVENYRRLETWGSSLFLGAIALLGKQLIEWKKPTLRGGTQAFELHELALLPLAISIVAFIFLRIANFRGRRARDDLRKLTSPSPCGTAGRSSRIGAFGWLTALMPLSMGYFASWYLLRGEVCPQVTPYLFWGGLFALLIAVIVDFCVRLPQ
jgi:hypothetical protein